MMRFGVSCRQVSTTLEGQGGFGELKTPVGHMVTGGRLDPRQRCRSAANKRINHQTSVGRHRVKGEIERKRSDIAELVLSGEQQAMFTVLDLFVAIEREEN